MAPKSESAAHRQAQSLNTPKGSNNSPTGKKRIKYTDTQRNAYTSILKIRTSEFKRARLFLLGHPDGEYFRADLSEHLNLPINHICRIVYELVDASVIEIAGKRLNPRSGIVLQGLRLVKKDINHKD